MTVVRHEHNGQNIHEYSREVGTGIAAVDDAAFVWLKANFPHRPWLLDANRQYTTAAPIDMVGAHGTQVLGGGSQLSTHIKATNVNAPIFLIGGEHQRIEHLSMSYNDLFASANTGLPAAAAAIEVTGPVSALCHFEDLFAVGLGKGIYSPPETLFFNNTANNCRFSNFTEYGIEIRNLGTGAHFTNTYLHSSVQGVASEATRTTCKSAVTLTGNQATIKFDQLNIEYMICTERPVFINAGGTAVFDSLWMESLSWPSNSEAFNVFGRGKAEIDGFEIIYSYPTVDISADPAETQAIFAVGGGSRLSVEEGTVRDNGVDSLYLLRAADQDQRSTARFEDFDDWGTVANLPGGQVAGAQDLLGLIPQAAWAQPTDAVFRRFNDDWFSMVDPAGTVHRMTVDTAGNFV